MAGKRARHDGGDVLRGAELEVVLAEALVAQPRGVQHQVVDGDVALRRPRLRLACGVEAVEHLQLVDLRHVFLRRVFELDLAFLDQLHDGRAAHRLGGREQRHHRVGGHRLSLAELTFAGRAFVEVGLAVGGHRHHAGRSAETRRRVLEHGVGDCLECLVHMRLLVGWPSLRRCLAWSATQQRRARTTIVGAPRRRR